MNGFLFDENLPINILFKPSLPIIHSTKLSKSLSDSKIWEYAKENNLIIVSKDTDFSERIIISTPPPKVIHIKFGNLRKKDFHALMLKIWLRLEEQIKTHKLINVYLDHFELIK